MNNKEPVTHTWRSKPNFRIIRVPLNVSSVCSKFEISFIAALIIEVSGKTNSSHYEHFRN